MNWGKGILLVLIAFVGLQAVLPQDLPRRAAGLPGVTRVQAMRVVPMAIHPALPSVALMARPLPQPEQSLPLVGTLADARPGETAVFVSEPAAALHRWQVGQTIRLPLPQGSFEVRVRGIWRDYARQFGAVAIDLADYQRLTGDLRLNDLSVWLAPGASPAQVKVAVRQLAGPTTRWIQPAPRSCAGSRWPSSIAASRSPATCRRWPSRWAWWAWRPACRHRCPGL